MTPPLKTIPLFELADIELLSTRSVNICQVSGLTDLNSILAYYHEHGTFKNIRNCGERSERELSEMCLKYASSVEAERNTLALINRKTNLEILSSLSLRKSLLFKKHFEFLRMSLTSRSFNALQKIFDLEYHDHKKLDDFLSESFKFTTINNLGTKSIKELELIRLELLLFLMVLDTISESELGKEYLRVIVKRSFAGLVIDFDEKLNDFIDSNNKIKLFKLIEFIFRESSVLKETEFKIYENIYQSDNSKNINLQQIALDVHLTRERVRQIKDKLEQRMSQILSFVLNFSQYDIISYSVDKEKKFSVINASLKDTINLNESCQYNVLFYGYIFQLLLHKSHNLIGSEKIPLQKRGTVKTNYINRYLIANHLTDIFDFDGFVEDILEKINARNAEDYTLNFQGYVFGFFNNYDKTQLDKIVSICETIIFLEFELLITGDGYLIIERNIKKPVHSYYLEIFEEAGKLMTIDEIAAKANERFPFLEATGSSVRGILNKEKSLFIYFGRTSTYGLRKWEMEHDNIRGGTIRDLVEEFILSADLPQHISKIVEYVNKYRDTNEKSVRANIKLDERKQFIFFKKGFVGLVDHNYSSNFLVNDTKRDWNARYSKLLEFLKVNYAWPSARSSDKNEQSLYVFLYRTRQKYKLGKLDEDRITSLNKINFPFDGVTGARKSWSQQYELLSHFKEVQKRWPSSSSKSPEELSLYRFCAETRRKFKRKKLKNDQIDKMLYIKFNLYG